MLAQGLTDRRWPGGLEGSAGPAPTSPPSPVALGPSLSVDWPHTDLLRGPGGLRAAPARVLGIPAVAGWRVCSLQLSRIPGLPPACPPPPQGEPSPHPLVPELWTASGPSHTPLCPRPACPSHQGPFPPAPSPPLPLPVRARSLFLPAQAPIPPPPHGGLLVALVCAHGGPLHSEGPDPGACSPSLSTGLAGSGAEPGCGRGCGHGGGGEARAPTCFLAPAALVGGWWQTSLSLAHEQGPPRPQQVRGGEESDSESPRACRSTQWDSCPVPSACQVPRSPQTGGHAWAVCLKAVPFWRLFASLWVS